MKNTMQIWKTIIGGWQRDDPAASIEANSAPAIVSHGRASLLSGEGKLSITLVARYPIAEGEVLIDGTRTSESQWSCRPLASWWEVRMVVDLPSLEPGLHTITLHPSYADPLIYGIRT